MSWLAKLLLPFFVLSNIPGIDCLEFLLLMYTGTVETFFKRDGFRVPLRNPSQVPSLKGHPMGHGEVGFFPLKLEVFCLQGSTSLVLHFLKVYLRLIFFFKKKKRKHKMYSHQFSPMSNTFGFLYKTIIYVILYTY